MINTNTVRNEIHFNARIRPDTSPRHESFRSPSEARKMFKEQMKAIDLERLGDPEEVSEYDDYHSTS